MRKATLHISNNQASVSITMPSSPQHKSQSKHKDNDDPQSNQVISSSSNLLARNAYSTDNKQQLVSPRSPSPLSYDKQLYDTDLLNTSNTTSFRYSSQSYVMSQSALSSALSTTMSNTHYNQQLQQQQSNQQTQLKSQQDLEEQFFATIEGSALAHNTFHQTQRQKSSKNR
jgi:hypothetical protein